MYAKIGKISREWKLVLQIAKIKKEHSNHGQGRSHLTKEGIRQIMQLVHKYPVSLAKYVEKFDELYPNREFMHAAVDYYKETEVLRSKLHEGYLKIKLFNISKPLDPIEKGLLWILGIVGFSGSLEAFFAANNTNLNSDIIKLLGIPNINLILFVTMLVIFFSLAIYNRYEP